MKAITIVGASLAGLRAAETLRREGFDGTINVVGDEVHRPYDRPPLSKQFLSGEWDRGRIELVRPESFDDLNLTWHLGAAATAIDPTNHAVTLASGEVLSAEGVVIATGARARTLPGSMAGVHTLRTVDDAQAVRQAFDSGVDRLVIIGSGFIGAEVAATARERGIDVTMIEMAMQPFERSLGAEVGSVLAEIHVEHGVDLRRGVGYKAFVGGDRVSGVELTDGTTVNADLVVVGIGVLPNTEWLDGSGLAVDDGVVCDETSLVAPGIVAAGDVARWPNQHFGDSMRVEHWDNATTQGVHAAKRLLHGPTVGPYAPVPWFWTDQYDRKIQLAGRTTGFDRFDVVEGSFAERRFAGLYARGGVLVAVVGFNRPRHVMRYRALIEAKTPYEHALAAEI